MRRARRIRWGVAAALVGISALVAGYYAVDLVHPRSAAGAGTSAASGAPAPAASGSVVDVLTQAGLVRSGMVDAGAVRALVDKIPAETDARTPAYDGAAYGRSWADTDHNGCDQRNDVLARDLTAVTQTKADPGCTVATGNLADVYTGRSIDFMRGKTTSAAVQIDHLVPLGWAWQHGAAAWTGEEIALSPASTEADAGDPFEDQQDLEEPPTVAGDVPAPTEPAGPSLWIAAGALPTPGAQAGTTPPPPADGSSCPQGFPDTCHDELDQPWISPKGGSREATNTVKSV